MLLRVECFGYNLSTYYPFQEIEKAYRDQGDDQKLK